MKFISTQKFIRMSPEKLRRVADVAREMSPEEAIEKLPFTKKKAATPLVKVIATALANAKLKGVSENLLIDEIQINEGPRLKRGRPVSRGRWHPIKRRMSHIRVVLTTKTEVLNTKSETNSRVQNKKIKTRKKNV